MSFSEFSTTTIKELFDEEIAAAGGVVSQSYHDESLLFARSVFPQVREVARGDKLQGGVALRADSTEVWVYPYVFRQVCANGAIMARTVQSRQIEFTDYVGGCDFSDALRQAVRECSAEEVFANSTEQMRSGARHPGRCCAYLASLSLATCVEPGLDASISNHLAAIPGQNRSVPFCTDERRDLGGSRHSGSPAPLALGGNGRWYCPEFGAPGASKGQR